MPPPPPIVLAALPLIFVAVWIGSMLLISATGGWGELAQVYRAGGPLPNARVWRNRHGRLRAMAGYNGCLNIAANAMGMQLSIWKIFAIGHPPLFIPWMDIETTVVKGLFFEYVRFSFRRASTTLTLRRALAEEISACRAVHGA